MKNLRSKPIVVRLLACLLLLGLALPSSPTSTAAQPRAAAPLLIDINPGSASSYPGGFVTVGDLVYFSADDGVHGQELWRSDGTSAGTIPLGQVSAWSSLFEVCSFSISPFGENIVIAKSRSTIQPCNGYVTVHSGLTGGTLWSKAGEKSETVIHGGRSYFFFTSQDASAPSGLWASAGSAPGIALVDPLPTDGWIDQVRAGAGAFYFTSYKPDNQGIPKSTLWKSTGAPGGISMVKEFPTDRLITSSAVFSDSLIFLVAGIHYTNTNELWRSDGTPAGTQSIRLPGLCCQGRRSELAVQPLHPCRRSAGL